jgi:hypothetical protein
MHLVPAAAPVFSSSSAAVAAADGDAGEIYSWPWFTSQIVSVNYSSVVVTSSATATVIYIPTIVSTSAALMSCNLGVIDRPLLICIYISLFVAYKRFSYILLASL